MAQGLFYRHCIDRSATLISHDTEIYKTISSSSSESNIMPSHYLELIVKQHLRILIEAASTQAHSVKDDCY